MSNPIGESFTQKMNAISKEKSIAERLALAGLSDEEILFYAKSNVSATRQSMEWEKFHISDEKFQKLVGKEYERVKALIEASV